MSRLTSGVAWAYSQFLRLYPPQFRTAFGEEMAAVFGEKVMENSQHGTAAVFTLALAELRDLPLQVIREHLHERRRRVLATNTGVIMTEARLSLQVFRVLSWSLFSVLAVFALMVVLPFFSLGLYTQTQMEVISGSIGPEAFFLYGGRPNVLPGVAVLVMLAAPIWNAIFGVGVLVMLAWFWRRLSPRYRKLGALAVVAAILPTLLMFLPVGINLASWWLN
jgi:hypothetical protein